MLLGIIFTETQGSQRVMKHNIKIYGLNGRIVYKSGTSEETLTLWSHNCRGLSFLAHDVRHGIAEIVRRR